MTKKPFVSRRELVTAAIALVAVACGAASADQEVSSTGLLSMIAILEGDDDKKKTDVVRSYAKNSSQYGIDGLRIPAIAVESGDETLSRLALVGVRRLVAKGEFDHLEIRSFLQEHSDFEAHLLGHIEGEDDRLSFDAGVAYYDIFGDSVAFEEAIVFRASSMKDYVPRRNAVRLIAVDGLKSERSIEMFEDILKTGEISDTSVIAAEILSMSEPIDPKMLPYIQGIALSDEYYAKPSIVLAIGEYGEFALDFLPSLKDMRAEVEQLSGIEPMQRTRALHNSSYSMQVLDEVIQRLEYLQTAE
ncbi:MAG: hypothetical protein AAF351_06940 [Pseudomonadota bacterium]